MDQPSSKEVVVLQIETSGTSCILTLEEGRTRTDFNLWFEDVRGICLLEGDGLTRWLMERGMLWALDPIGRLLHAAVFGQMPQLPCRLSDPKREHPGRTF
jgi:hypothetical protein